MTRLLSLLFCLAPSLGAAQDVDMSGYDVVLIGELHDNPAHHRIQAELVAALAPRALVFEMLTAEQAGKHIAGADETTLEAALGWNASGWPDFSMYYPIFAAAPDAEIFGAAVPREDARAAMTAGLAHTFGPQAEAYGLMQALPDGKQSAREAMQMAAHCDALPEEMLGGMVDIQRLRDARLAQEIKAAFERTSGPVAVITGNGHARADWGVPVYLARVLPEARILTIGQGEQTTGAPDGSFDVVLSASAPARGDPCAAFK